VDDVAMTPELAEALLDVATTPDVTPWRASEVLRAAGAGPRDRVRELTDKRLWAVVGGRWMTLDDWAEELVSA
jgi:hypothetical protein